MFFPSRDNPAAETLHAAVARLWKRSGARCRSPSAPYEAISCCSAEKGNKTPSHLFDLSLLYLSSPFFLLRFLLFSRAYPQPPRLLLSFSVISHHYVESRKTLCALRAVHFQPNLITDTGWQGSVSFLHFKHPKRFHFCIVCVRLCLRKRWVSACRWALQEPSSWLLLL